MLRPHPAHALPALIALLTASLVALASGAPNAFAGTYVVRYCETPNESGLTDWRPQNQAERGELKEGCRQGNPMVIDGSAAAPGNRGSLRWVAEAPPGLSIADFATSASLTQQYGDDGAGPAPASGYYLSFAINGTGDPSKPAVEGKAAGCGRDFAPSPLCGSSGVYALSSGNPIFNGKRAEIQVVCETRFTEPEVDQCQGSFFVRVNSAAITWSDSQAPTGGAEGPLLASGPGAPVSGSPAVKVTAADVGSGVQRLEARVRGQRIGVTSNRCTPPYVRAEPCPKAIAEEFTADTSKLASGTHELEIIAVDASGNEAVISRTPLVVDNGGGAIGPGGDPNLRGAPNGSYGADDARVRLWWPATGKAPSKKRAVQRRCQKSKAYRRKHATACVGRAPKATFSTTYNAKRSNRLRGRLTAANGTPIAGAQVRVAATVAGRVQALAAPTTDAEGEFTANLPVREGTAAVTASWHARQRDSVPAASAQARRSVRSFSTFTVARKARAGGRLFLGGKLLGAAGTRKGVPVLIQANAGNGWRAAMTVLVEGNGRWLARYGVPRQLRGTYRFRARILRAGSYPYEPSTTRSRTVRIR